MTFPVTQIVNSRAGFWARSSNSKLTPTVHWFSESLTVSAGSFFSASLVDFRDVYMFEAGHLTCKDIGKSNG